MKQKAVLLDILKILGIGAGSFLIGSLLTGNEILRILGTLFLVVLAVTLLVIIFLGLISKPNSRKNDKRD